MRKVISTAYSLRADLNVFMMWHPEDVTTDGSIVGYKCATVGKLLDVQFNPTEIVTMTLFAQPQFDDKGTPKYGFYTNKCLEKRI